MSVKLADGNKDDWERGYAMSYCDCFVRMLRELPRFALIRLWQFGVKVFYLLETIL